MQRPDSETAFGGHSVAKTCRNVRLLPGRYGLGGGREPEGVAFHNRVGQELPARGLDLLLGGGFGGSFQHEADVLPDADIRDVSEAQMLKAQPHGFALRVEQLGVRHYFYFSDETHRDSLVEGSETRDSGSDFGFRQLLAAAEAIRYQQVSAGISRTKRRLIPYACRATGSSDSPI